MRRVLFEWHGIAIPAYPAMLFLGMILGVAAGNYAANAAGVNAARVYVATLLLIVPALAGARLLFVASHWAIYRRQPARFWRRSEGGASLYGGLLLAVAMSVPVLWAMGLDFWAFWDISTFTILIGTVVTKAGCLLNGCCAGRITTGLMGLYLPNHLGVWAHRMPSQLLEAAWAAVLLVGAAAAWKHVPFDGALFLAAVTGYGLGRSLLELTRETIDRVGPLSLHRLISWSLAALSLAAMLTLWLRVHP